MWKSFIFSPMMGFFKYGKNLNYRFACKISEELRNPAEKPKIAHVKFNVLPEEIFFKLPAICGHHPNLENHSNRTKKEGYLNWTKKNVIEDQGTVWL